MSSNIESMMKEIRSFAPSADFSQRARVGTLAEYEKLYRESVEAPDAFWGRMANENLHWFQPWTRVQEQNFEHIGESTAPYTRWFQGGRLNVSYNCLDRHLAGPRRNKAAFIWQGEKEEEKRTLTYHQVHSEVCRLANVLKKHGVRKGHTITIFMPMIPEMNAEDPLFILYTSGSTGKPKGVLHTTGGYLVYATGDDASVCLRLPRGDVYWCTADVGWVTGHSYIVYGPLANGATTRDVRGRAHLPRCRPLLGGDRQAQGQHLLHRADRHPRLMGRATSGWRKPPVVSLRLLGSVGEPINPEAWMWYHRVSARAAARSSIPGGRPRPAAS
jgi:acyl-coenzyme A synthetase/AMP-(fatty) acid ligase